MRIPTRKIGAAYVLFFTAVSAGPLNNFNYVFLSKCKLEVNFLSLFNVNRSILLFKDGFCSQGS